MNEAALIERNLEQAVSETDPFTIERYLQMARFIPRATRILDVGCNTGRGGEALKAQLPDASLMGLDIVQQRLDALPQAYSRGVLSFTTDIREPDDSYDAIVAGEFLEHVPACDIDKTLCEFQRILKVGGRLVMTTPNPGSMLNRYIRRRSVLNRAHVTQHWPRLLALRLRMHGFGRVRLYGSGKTTRYLGQYFPLACYGSFLVAADKW